MLSLLARAVAGPVGSLGRSRFSSFAPWWRAALLPAPVTRALPPWCRTAAPRPLLALPPPAGLLPPLVAGLKSKVSLKRRCKDCFMVRRRGRLYVLCKTNPRHKQRQL